MAVQVEPQLQRWLDARIIDAATADRIRAFERSKPSPAARSWPMLIAVIFGSLMLAAGILLFVAAHWENMSPWERFGLVMLMVGLMHVVGVVTHERSPNLSWATPGR